MTTREDILERLAYADALGHGPQTSALIAEAVSWADALGDEDLRIATRLALTEAYQQGNEAWKALAPFSWNLGRYQRRPEAFDDAQVRTLHWHFKWAVAVAGANPRVSKDKVRQLEASLEEFYRSGGASMHVVHGERASVAGLLGLEEEAAEELAAWRAGRLRLPHRGLGAGRGHCRARADRRRQLLRAAPDHAVPRTAAPAGLRSAPGGLGGAPALLPGDPPQPQGSHLPGLSPGVPRPCGAELLRRHLSWLAQAESAYVLLSALRGMSLVLREAERAGRGEEALGVEVPAADLWYPLPGLEASTTISRVYAEMTGWARRLAQQFDMRNGNSTISDHLERSLARAAFDAAPGAVHGLGVEVDLLEPSEELPEAAQTSLTVDEDGAAPDVASLLGLVADDDGLVQEHAPRPTSSSQEAAGRRARAATSHQSGDAPFPLVDLVRPRPVRNGEEAVRRYVDHRRTIGSSTMDYWYVVDQVATRDLLPPRGEEIPGLEYHTGLLRAAAMTCRTEMDEAIAERLRIRPLIELAFGPLGAYYVDLLNLDNEITADSIAELSQDVLRDERLQRATSLIGQIEAQVEDLVSTELLDPGGTDALVLAADALLVGASVLTDLHAKDEALGAIQVVARAAEAVPEDRHAERMEDILDMARAEVLAECGDVYNGCLLAEEVMRRHEKVSPVLAARGRRLLGISSMEVGQFDEAIAQFREQANIMLAAGITLYAVASLLSLGWRAPRSWSPRCPWPSAPGPRASPCTCTGSWPRPAWPWARRRASPSTRWPPPASCRSRGAGRWRGSTYRMRRWPPPTSRTMWAPPPCSARPPTWRTPAPTRAAWIGGGRCAARRGRWWTTSPCPWPGGGSTRPARSWRRPVRPSPAWPTPRATPRPGRSATGTTTWPGSCGAPARTGRPSSTASPPTTATWTPRTATRPRGPCACWPACTPSAASAMRPWPPAPACATCWASRTGTGMTPWSSWPPWRRRCADVRRGLCRCCPRSVRTIRRRRARGGGFRPVRIG